MGLENVMQELLDCQNNLRPKDKQVEFKKPQLTASQIKDTIEKHTGFIPSQEIIDFWLSHNNPELYILASQGMFLINLDTAIESYNIWMNIVKDNDYPYNNNIWKNSFFPLMENGGGDSIIIDLEDQTIRTFYHDMDEYEKPVKSLQELFEKEIELYKDNKFIYIEEFNDIEFDA